MVWNFARFDFGKSYFRDVSVIQLIKEKLPVSMSLGIWMTLLDLSDLYTARYPQGGTRTARDSIPGPRRDASCVGFAIPGFLFAILLIILFAGGSFFNIFPAARPDFGRLGAISRGTGRSSIISGIITLPLISMGAGRLRHHDAVLTKNSFLDEIRKQYVMTARAKGCSEWQVLYNHVFRNAMLIVIAGFPGSVHPRFLLRARC